MIDFNMMWVGRGIGNADGYEVILIAVIFFIVIESIMFFTKFFSLFRTEESKGSEDISNAFLVSNIFLVILSFLIGVIVSVAGLKASLHFLFICLLAITALLIFIGLKLLIWKAYKKYAKVED